MTEKKAIEELDRLSKEAFEATHLVRASTEVAKAAKKSAAKAKDRVIEYDRSVKEAEDKGFLVHFHGADDLEQEAQAQAEVAKAAALVKKNAKAKAKAAKKAYHEALIRASQVETSNVFTDASLTRLSEPESIRLLAADEAHRVPLKGDSQ